MPKVTTARQKAQKNSKEQSSEATNRAFGPIFNKDLGQHILKNPLVAQGIVDKVQLTHHRTTGHDRH
jgi:18S rRNA (adenine1779-N6/adenine1780-N6)-dimethyltransferase